MTEAAVYLASAPKSNSLYILEKKMKQIAEKYKQANIPWHIINPSDFLAARRGAGKGYVYAHDFPEKTTIMKTIPDEVEEEDFYEPNQMGFEKKIKERIEYWRQVKAKLRARGAGTLPEAAIKKQESHNN